MDVVWWRCWEEKVIEKERLEFGFGVFLNEGLQMGGSRRSAALCVPPCARAFVFVEADRHKHIAAHCPPPSLSLVYRLRRTTHDLCLFASECAATLLLLILSKAVEPQRLFKWLAWFEPFFHPMSKAHWMIKHAAREVRLPCLCLMSEHKWKQRGRKDEPFFISGVVRRRLRCSGNWI